MQNNAMQQTFEVEVRGPLAEQQPAHIEEYLKKYGTFIGEKKRVLIDYSFFLKGEGIAERTRDIRLRATNGVPEKIVPTILDVPRTHEEIRQLCKEMGLSIFSNEDYFAYVEKLNKDVRVIFDFAHYTDGYFHTTFGI